ncbi:MULTISPECIES: hypothetical protein [Psychrobacter]|jgi:hypothetical protein|uniref:hypothetical protein n=1 Tax=Psychrobacter TaxID=497 RepID=UPI0022F1B7AE|nr:MULTISPECIES: hypothetical protein [unclassified Psychrobacter]MDA5132184.1 hypothetical protein [Psychrobacter sp. ANT_H3]
MNKLLGVLLLGSTLSLTACGGDSDSSGSSYTGSNSAPTTPNTQPTTPPKPSIAKCKSEGNNVYVPREGTCTFAIPNVNGGKESSYECSGNTVTLGSKISGGISAGSLNFNGYIVQCAK